MWKHTSHCANCEHAHVSGSIFVKLNKKGFFLVLQIAYLVFLSRALSQAAVTMLTLKDTLTW